MSTVIELYSYFRDLALLRASGGSRTHFTGGKPVCCRYTTRTITFGRLPLLRTGRSTGEYILVREEGVEPSRLPAGT